MKIYNLDSILPRVENKFLFLDNTALILLVAYFDLFNEFLEKLEKIGCALITIPSVLFEFQRTDNIDSYNKRADFIKKYVSVYPIEKHLESLQELTPVIHKIKGNVSYSDFLLYCCLYKFNSSILFSENHKDFTTDLLDRINVVTIDNESSTIRNSAFYIFNRNKYEKTIRDILK